MSAPPGAQVYVTRKRGFRDPEGHSAAVHLRASPVLEHLQPGQVRHTRVYLLEGLEASTPRVQELVARLLGDPVTEEVSFGSDPAAAADLRCLEVARRPGVTEPVEASVRWGLSLCGLEVTAVHVLRRYWLPAALPPQELLEAACRHLASDVIEEVRLDPPPPAPHPTPPPYRFERITWPLREATDEELVALSARHTLSLNLPELHAIQAHYRGLGREPTDVEIETIAQTWSEHCKHKTLTGRIDMDGRRIDNLLRSTIMRVTETLDPEWCWSVFVDNAGVIAFDEDHGLAFKVETHNHPSAIEPYGGAGTGIGGVIRDVLGTGLGARPIAGLDVFGFADPSRPGDQVPRGALHPRRLLEGVVAGVRDYGNRMGIPTVVGAVYFDERYVGNPVVFCGTLGVIPRDQVQKRAHPGDHIVSVGGRTGRDGIHGATFSSMELTEESEVVSSGAVQIGDPITEKKMLDVLLQARDRGLYRAITDCGAGGYSSAVGEMGEEIGARVELDRVPLKYLGLSYTEIWISEAQERMVLAVPPEHLDALLACCAAEDVAATVIGTYTDTGRLELRYRGEPVGDLEMEFLHHGLPRLTRQATWRPPAPTSFHPPPELTCGEALRRVLASPTVASKEWIIRQYDHEVQGCTIGKPLVGQRHDGPADAAVLLPFWDSPRAVAVACGCNPSYGDLDPYRMGTWVVDEALRNLVAVGASMDRVALLDNFSWGNCDRPEQLGSLVLAAEGAADAALAHGAPFISGKDSLNNEFATAQGTVAIPPTLLISALGQLEDASRMVTMDLKEAGNHLYLLGTTRDELGGSQLGRILGCPGGEVPGTDLELARRLFATVSGLTAQGLVRSLHDCSEGGLAVAAAEMAIAGGLGATLRLHLVPRQPQLQADLLILFSESASRLLAEVSPRHAHTVEERLEGLPWARIGQVTTGGRLSCTSTADPERVIVDEPIEALRQAWQRTLDLSREPRS